jgi:hypothetical protein
MELGASGQTEGFAQCPHQQPHEANMVATDIGGFAAVVRILGSGFYCRHAAGFFAPFDALTQHEGTTGKGHQGIMLERDVSPLSEERVELPGGGPEKVQDKFIAFGAQEEPTDDAGDAEVIAANEPAEDNDDKPLKGRLA